MTNVLLDRRALLKTGSVLGLSTLALGLMPRATGSAARKVFASGHGTFCAALRFIVQEGDSAP